MLGSAESEMVRLISREIIFAVYSNLYDHDSSTSHPDGRTDNLPWQLYTALRVASRGKKQTLKLCNGPALIRPQGGYL